MKKFVILGLTAFTSLALAQNPDECAEVVLGRPGQEFKGQIIPDPLTGSPKLSSEDNPDGISIFNGCRNSAGEDIATNPAITVVSELYSGQFEINNLDPFQKVQNSVLRLSSQYNLISSVDIVFDVKGCPPQNSDDENCKSVKVTVTYQINEFAPEFNKPFGEGLMEDAEKCLGDFSSDCKVIFKSPFFANDGDDEDVVKYLFHPPDQRFVIQDDTDLDTLYYTAVGEISENTFIDLYIKAKDNRWDKDTRSSFAKIIVEVKTSATTPTTSTEEATTTEPEKNKEKLYLALMITFVVLFGLLLFAILGYFIFVSLCKRDSVLGITGTMSKKSYLKKSGVVTTGALYRSFSEMNYDTLEEKRSTASSSPDLDAKISASGRVKAKTSNPKITTIVTEDP